MRLFVYIMFVLVLVSCERELPFDGFNNSPKTVVQCRFTDDSLIKVEISTTGDILSTGTDNRLINDAQVSVSDSFGVNHMLNFNGTVYESGFKPLAGMPYYLHVKLNNLQEIEAVSSIPSDTLIFTLDTFTGPSNRLDARLKFANAPFTQQYYLIRLLEYSAHYVVNSQGKTDTITGWFPLKIESGNNIFESNLAFASGINAFEMFTDKFFDGQLYTLNLLINRDLLNKSQTKSKSDSVQFYLSAITPECYNFYLTVLKNNNNYGGPFSTNLNPVGNITNGLGIFTGYRHAQKKVGLK